MKVEVRHAKDPHVLFSVLTHGSYELDEKAGGQIAAGVLLILFSICMLGMSCYKTYRFCIKYTLKDYQRVGLCSWK